MANYVKITDFASKDALLTGNPSKVVRGTEIDAEFEALESAIATKADTTSPTFTGSPLAPTQASNTNNTTIATTAFVRSIIPAGIVLLWSGSVATIPVGWALCDGSGGTPDLRDKFVVGAGSTYAVGAAGGTKDAVVVSHTHTATVTDPGHSHTVPQTVYVETGSGNFIGGSNGSTPEGSVNPTSTTSTTGITVANSTEGVSGTNANLPPYYALAYIIKL